MGYKFILYDERLPEDTRDYVLFHEMGHHLMGHLIEDEELYNKLAPPESRENVSDTFAAVMLALQIHDEMNQKGASA